MSAFISAQLNTILQATKDVIEASDQELKGILHITCTAPGLEHLAAGNGPCLHEGRPCT